MYYLAAGLDRLDRQRQRQPRAAVRTAPSATVTTFSGRKTAVGARPVGEEEDGQHVPLAGVKPASGGEGGGHKKSC